MGNGAYRGHKKFKRYPRRIKNAYESTHNFIPVLRGCAASGTHLAVPPGAAWSQPEYLEHQKIPSTYIRTPRRANNSAIPKTHKLSIRLDHSLCHSKTHPSTAAPSQSICLPPSSTQGPFSNFLQPHRSFPPHPASATRQANMSTTQPHPGSTRPSGGVPRHQRVLIYCR